MGNQVYGAYGFTLIEWLVALTIVALLAALAAPSFASLRRAAGLSAATNELLWALHYARSASIMEGRPVTLCLTRARSRCLESAAGPARGWMVFPADVGAQSGPAPAESKPGADSTLLQQFQLSDELTVHGSRAAVTFWPVARVGTTSTFDLCESVGRGGRVRGGARVRGRAIVVSQLGRPRVAAEEAACAP